VAFGLLAFALGACGDSAEEARPVVSREDYETEVARLCAQHGPILSRAYGDVVVDSDAEEAAYYRADFIPRGRAVIRGLAEFGFPEGEEEGYIESLNGALDALATIEESPFRYIDQRHDRVFTPEEDLVNRFRAGIEGADIVCE